MINLMCGDCLDLMKAIPDKSVDMILCDLPYGTTSCVWDSIIPFDKLWTQYSRIIKDTSAIVLFGQEPFSSMLRISNINMFKYDFYWVKSRPSGFTNAKLKPLKDIETISVFSCGTCANGSNNNMNYYPQGITETNLSWSRPNIYYGSDNNINPTRKNTKKSRIITHTGYPRQCLYYANPNNATLHPTQKPVDLLEYLIKTYTTNDQVVLDNCMGSGSTGIACLKTNRSFIGIEQDEKYFNIASERINKELNKPDISKFME